MKQEVHLPYQEKNVRKILLVFILTPFLTSCKESDYDSPGMLAVRRVYPNQLLRDGTLGKYSSAEDVTITIEPSMRISISHPSDSTFLITKSYDSDSKVTDSVVVSEKISNQKVTGQLKPLRVIGTRDSSMGFFTAPISIKYAKQEIVCSVAAYSDKLSAGMITRCSKLLW